MVFTSSIFIAPLVSPSLRLAWHRTDRRSQLVPSHMPTSSDTHTPSTHILHTQTTRTPNCGLEWRTDAPAKVFPVFAVVAVAHWHSFPWQMCPSPAPLYRRYYLRQFCLSVLEFCRLVSIFSLRIFCIGISGVAAKCQKVNTWINSKFLWLVCDCRLLVGADDAQRKDISVVIKLRK